MEEKQKKIRLGNIIYEKTPDFKSYYITGAIGGFRNPYDCRLAFYNADTTEFMIKTEPIKKDQSLPEEEKIKTMQETTMKNKVMCEIIMSARAAKELHDFLGKELEFLEKTMKKMDSSEFEE